jgi:secreted trypsin-like serine protease
LLAWVERPDRCSISNTAGQPMTQHTTRARHWVAAAALVLCLPAAQASTAAYGAMLASGLAQEGVFPRIVARDDVGLAGAAAFAADPAFAGVVALGVNGGQYCSGVLVAPTTVLSARHCGPAAGEFAQFGSRFDSPTFTSNIQSVLYPAGGTSASSLLDGGDLAIITLATAVPSNVAMPFLLTDATTALTGLSITTLGYGNTGVGSTGATGFDGVRRGGTNVMDRYGEAVDSSAPAPSTANIFSTDFDDPAGTSNTLGWLGSSATATTFEATTASGDSGGPLLFDNGGRWTVLGVLSGGTTDTSIYGDISWWTGVAPYRAQIEAAGGVFITAIPEPGSYALMLLGLGLITAWLRRSARR